MDSEVKISAKVKVRKNNNCIHHTPLVGRIDEGLVSQTCRQTQTDTQTHRNRQIHTNRHTDRYMTDTHTHI